MTLSDVNTHPSAPDRPLHHPILVRLAALFAVIATALALTVSTAGTASAATAAEAKLTTAVFNLLNLERAVNRLPALRSNPRLRASARMHNAAMLHYNQMSHQCAGEPGLGVRISHFGYRWRGAAENIGWTTDISVAGATHIQNVMYQEKAPNNGHRLNILSRTSRDVGVDIVIDAPRHKIWLTTDFGTPA
jgi:uncharacterized protein YkwD